MYRNLIVELSVSTIERLGSQIPASVSPLLATLLTPKSTLGKNFLNACQSNTQSASPHYL